MNTARIRCLVLGHDNRTEIEESAEVLEFWRYRQTCVRCALVWTSDWNQL